MKIKILDFEKVARCYKPYIDGITILEKRSNDLSEELGNFQKQAQEIMANASGNGLVLDEATLQSKQQEAQEQVQRLQQEAMLKDRTFKQEADEEQRRLVTEAYTGITDIVNEFISIGNDVEIVLNRSEVVFFKEEHDLTNTVIEILKEKSLFVEDSLVEQG